MKYYNLNDLCVDIIDCPDSTPVWKNKGIRVVRNFNLKNGNLDFTDGYFVDEDTYKERTTRAVPEEGDIIISREAPVGTVGIVPRGLKCCLGQRLVLLKVDKEKVDPFYLLNVLMSDFVQTQFKRADSTGSIVSNLCIPDLKKIVIPVIDKNQDLVTKFLQMVNAKQLLNEETNLILENKLKLLYTHWFLQFDFPTADGKPYKSSGGKMVFSHRLSMNIPVSWEIKPLLDLCVWESNSQPPKSEFIYEEKEGYIRFIQNRDYESELYKTYVPLTKNIKTVGKYDILMDKYGDAGKVRYGIEGAFNVALGKIKPKNVEYREYIRSFLEDDNIYRFLNSSCMASTRASLNESNLALLDVVIPDTRILEIFNDYAKKLREIILQNNEENRALRTLKEWILPMLMNGQATIKDM